MLRASFFAEPERSARGSIWRRQSYFVYASVVHQNWNRHRKKETTENRQEGMYLSKGGRDIAGRTRGGRACTETKRNSWKRRVSRDELISLQRTGSESRRNILWRHRREAARGICAAMRADEAKGRPRGPYQLHSSASPCRRGPPGPTAAVKLRLRKQQYCPDVFSYNDKITKKKKKKKSLDRLEENPTAGP